MKLRNYTSSVPVERSVSVIESLLVEAGATHVARFYDGKSLSGFLFQLSVDDIPVTFKLPSNPLAVRRIMESEVRKPRRGTMNRVWDQAERTAWKILAEWVHLQVTMILMQQAEAIQIFLPYAYDGKNDKTFFEKLKGNGFKQLASATTMSTQ